MKKIFTLSAISLVILYGCSSAYKAGRTPDDVYYSPAKPMLDNGSDRYENYSNGDDNYLHMKVQNRYQWDAIDDYAYWNDSRYDFGYSCFPSRSVLLNPYSPYFGISYQYYVPWANWYNPSYTIVYYKNPKVYYGTTSKTNLNAYSNGNYYSSQHKSFGSLLKSAFSNNSYNNYNSYNNGNTTNTRSFSSGTPISNSAGGRSGGFNSSGSSAGGARPPRR